MSEAEKARLTALWKAEVADRSSEIDSAGEHHWHTLCYGWALGKGVQPEEAYKFATYIRYDTDLG